MDIHTSNSTALLCRGSKLVNIDNEDDVLNWADESLKALEGSREAFYERKDIYESNNT